MGGEVVRLFGLTVCGRARRLYSSGIYVNYLRLSRERDREPPYANGARWSKDGYRKFVVLPINEGQEVYLRNEYCEVTSFSQDLWGQDSAKCAGPVKVTRLQGSQGLWAKKDLNKM